MKEPIRILVVDDNATFLEIVLEYLRRQDQLAVVGATQRGQEALALAQQVRPQVVLLDLRMPDLPGLEAIPHLRASLPGLGIIILTQHSLEAYRQAALAAGADEFVSKRRLIPDLLPAIRRVAEIRERSIVTTGKQ
jgi:DNA-binding NarL/FixJ family response regulator